MNLSEKINALLEAAVKNGDISGANILVIKNGEEKAYAESGLRDMENALPVERDTIFRLYSQTKPVTAAAAALAASEGIIDISADIADYLPEFSEIYVNNGERFRSPKAITVRDLLNMTSGLAYPHEGTAGGEQAGGAFWQIDQRMETDNPVTTAEFSRMMAKTDLCNIPGEKFMYGTSADIMGALIERASGMSFREYLLDRFFTPLQMNDTDFWVPAEKQNRLAKIYDYNENGLYECRTSHLGLRYERDVIPAFQSGGAGLCSTLDDYSKFALMLMNGGEYNGKRIMPGAAVRFLTSGGINPKLSYQLQEGWDWMTGYTYGNFMRICENEKITSLFSSEGEYGWDGWLGTFFSNEPKHGITLLMGVQQVGIGRAGTLLRKIKNVVMSELA